MKYFEVTVSLSADKTLLVAAADEQDAERRAMNALENGDIDMTDAEVMHDVIEVKPANDLFYELPDYCGIDEADEVDDESDESDDCDCDNCQFRDECHRATKLMHLSNIVLSDMDALIEEMSRYCGED